MFHAIILILVCDLSQICFEGTRQGQGTHSKGQGSPAPAGNGGGCYASAPAAAPACSIAASCCGSVAVDAGAFRLRLRVCLATARFAEDILLTIKAGPASNASRRLVGTRMSFREVVRSWMAPVLLHVLLRCHSARSWIVPRRHPSTRSWIVACGRT